MRYGIAPLGGDGYYGRGCVTETHRTVTIGYSSNRTCTITPSGNVTSARVLVCQVLTGGYFTVTLTP